MSKATLGIRHLRDEQVVLRKHGFYWVSVDLASDAELLVSQCLSTLPAQQPTTLVTSGYPPGTLVDDLDEDSGPDRLHLLEVAERDLNKLLRSIVSELNRGVRAKGSLIVLLLPAQAADFFEKQSFSQWCEAVRAWLRKRDCTLLVVCHGQLPDFYEVLKIANEQLSGLAQLYRRNGKVCYQLSYWHSDIAVCASQTLELDCIDETFELHLVDRDDPNNLHADDHRIYLTQKSALEGTPPLTQHWRLFEDRTELLQQALGARAASVIVAIEANDQVEDLARQLHHLRNHCGAALKIIVREMEPCLRYRDERLLLACGANLVVPVRAQLAHFLSLIDSIQGHVWHHRSNVDFQTLSKRMHPPHVRGLLTPKDFIDTLDQIYSGASGEMSHQLLQMRPRGGLAVEQFLSQITLRRYGDIACVLDGTFYLFLFACRADGLVPALGNICRLPWKDLFSTCESLPSADLLPRHEMKAVKVLPDNYLLADERLVRNVSQSTGLAGFTPERTTLSLSEPCP